MSTSASAKDIMQNTFGADIPSVWTANSFISIRRRDCVRPYRIVGWASLSIVWVDIYRERTHSNLSRRSFPRKLSWESREILRLDEPLPRTGSAEYIVHTHSKKPLAVETYRYHLVVACQTKKKAPRSASSKARGWEALKHGEKRLVHYFAAGERRQSVSVIPDETMKNRKSRHVQFSTHPPPSSPVSRIGRG